VKSGRPIMYNFASRKQCLKKSNYFFVFLPTLSVCRMVGCEMNWKEPREEVAVA
jgi:hypothetical protein